MTATAITWTDITDRRLSPYCSPNSWKVETGGRTYLVDRRGGAYHLQTTDWDYLGMYATPADVEAAIKPTEATEAQPDNGSRFCLDCGQVFDTTANLDAHQDETGHERDSAPAPHGPKMTARKTRQHKAAAKIRARSAATRLAASLHRGRSIATHVIAAGVDADAVAGVVNGLRSVAKRLQIAPVRVTRTSRTIHGRDGHSHRCGHYTTAQIQLLVSAYKPRKSQYVAAKHQLAA